MCVEHRSVCANIPELHHLLFTTKSGKEEDTETQVAESKQVSHTGRKEQTNRIWERDEKEIENLKGTRSRSSSSGINSKKTNTAHI